MSGTASLTIHEEFASRLTRLGRALIDQQRARPLVMPQAPEPGFWFGGGNVIDDGTEALYLCGRYRNAGDSRTGLQAGPRGLECAIFRSDDDGQTFQKVRCWSKQELSQAGAPVLSIEGTALRRTSDGEWELFVSTEKQVDYPTELASFQKPGTGVWSIDVMRAPSIDALDPGTLQPVLSVTPPAGHLHVKDPVVFDNAAGETVLIFCTHPFCWSSSNTGYAVRRQERGAFELGAWQMVERGPAWDVAATRITGRLALPTVGVLADEPATSMYFYDGAECLRPLDPNPRAVQRARGYSCEEIGGAMWGRDIAFPQMQRLSENVPLFVSPHATGCSRYVDVLRRKDGLLATWQQAQADGSQPLVGHWLAMERVEEILG